MGLDIKPELKARAIEEFKAFWVIACYLWLFLGAFTAYRRLVIAETGFAYLHYGVALVEALIIAKVILVGRLFGFTRRFEDRALIVPVLYKSLLFALLVVLFGAVERIVEGMVHKEGIGGGLRRIVELGGDEFAARIVILVVAFIPFFAFGELGRVLGYRKLASMFLTGAPTVRTTGEA